MTAHARLVVARDYIARGEDYYRKAAEEIVAAMKEDPTLSFAAVGKALGKGKDYARRLVLSYTSDSPESGGIDWERGSHATVAERQAAAQKVFSDAPLEQVEQIARDIPASRRAEIAQAMLGVNGEQEHYAVVGRDVGAFGRHNDVRTTSVNESLVVAIGRGTRRLDEAIEFIVGTWHDKAPIASPEERAAAKDDIAAILSAAFTRISDLSVEFDREAVS